MAILDTIANKLIADAVVDGASGWTVSKGYMPDSVATNNDQVIGIFEYDGGIPDTCNLYPRISVMIRGKEYEYNIARTKADAVVTSLDNATLSGFVFILLSSNVFSAGYDTNNRPILTVNFKTMVSR